MKFLNRCGLVLFVAVFTSATVSLNAWAAELETDEQKLGYIIGMDIGNSLREQGADIDLDALMEALRTTFNGEETLLTAEEAGAIRQAYIQKRQQEQQAETAAQGQANLAEGHCCYQINGSGQGYSGYGG